MVCCQSLQPCLLMLLSLTSGGLKKEKEFPLIVFTADIHPNRLIDVVISSHCFSRNSSVNFCSRNQGCKANAPTTDQRRRRLSRQGFLVRLQRHDLFCNRPWSSHFLKGSIIPPQSERYDTYHLPSIQCVICICVFFSLFFVLAIINQVSISKKSQHKYVAFHFLP